MSGRWAGRVIVVDRASVRYQGTRLDDGHLRERPKALGQELRRFGYRGLNVLLRRKGEVVNRKRGQRSTARSGWRSQARDNGTRRLIKSTRPLMTAC